MVLILGFAAPGFRAALWRTGGAIRFQLRAGDVVLRLQGMIFVGCQFCLQAFGADRWRILIARAMRDKRFVGDVQGELTVFTVTPHRKRVLPRERVCPEAHVLDQNTSAHFAPGTKTRAFSVGAGLTGLGRLARRRFGGVPSASSTTIMLVTNILIP